MQTLNVLDNRFSPFNTFSTLSADTLTADALAAQNFIDSKKLTKRNTLLIIEQLQTTLDLDELLTIFAREVARYLDFSGLYFKCPSVSKTLRGSRKAKKERQFQLKINNDYIGTLTYSINAPISIANFKILEQLHQCLLHPLKNAVAYHQAMQLAMQDALTGLGNRRYFDEQLKRAMHNANRHHSLVGLVLGDLNKFKAINDNYGHPTGDKVLIEFANILRTCIRDSDSLFRFGGDEFAIIVENANEDALAIIEQRVLQALPENVLLAKYKLGCSLGSTFINRADDEHSFFERADQALYRKKMNMSHRLSVV
ncbi:GGDEF domain-containing protein [Litorilituus lipolyticus]|uniref:diguanylate cyclase n=1 Tax=Litorilituus lipolyticus TaxID=2491017 RepID=A0A502KQI8_9GAMM|nr:GGDEF domain-containing protein [Litorilituus lipolyticus]TPH12579.1 GGDEF domain-containing protein [Litorilituus lipolyticus]